MSDENSSEHLAATDGSSVLLDAKALARLLSVSSATVWRMDAAGKLPRPLRISSGTTRWHRPTIERWLSVCDSEGRLIDRAEWQTITEKSNGRRLR